MKVLTICSHGNIRSVALAYLLKAIYGHEAIAIGVEDTSVETRQMLYAWSDRICPLADDINAFISQEMPLNSIDKIRLCNVGGDIWFDSKHQALLHKIYKKLRHLDL